MSTADLVADLTAEYHEDGITILPRSSVVTQLKDRSEDTDVAHSTVRDAFESEGWAYSRHIYYQPEELTERAATIADSLRNAGRILVSEEEVIDRVADPTPRGTEKGWQKSDAIELLRDQFRDADWQIQRATKPYSNSTKSKMLYFRPLLDVVESEHPSGRGAFTTEDLFSWYLSQSVHHETQRE